MNDWIESEIGELLKLNYGWSLPDKKRRPGEYPVYGSNGIVGYHDEALVNTSGLVIGRKGSAGNVHYSRKPFCPIDTTFFVTSNDTDLDIEFLYYLLLHIDLKRVLGDVGVPGLNRQVAYRERANYPSKNSEQRRIAYVLSTVQTAIEQQERLIALTRELKAALMKKLFTEGLRGEKQKETEIGLVPESWRIVKLQDACQLIIDCPHTTPKFQSAGVRVARNFNIRDGRFVFEHAFFTTEDEYQQRIKRAEPKPGDILFSREAPVGEACLIPQNMKLSLGQRTMLLRTNPEKLDATFMVYNFYSPNVRQRMLSIASGLTVAHLNVADVRSLAVAVPTVLEQIEIGHYLTLVDDRIEIIQAKLSLLEELFRSLLHQLMTAQIRVNDIDLPGLN